VREGLPRRELEDLSFWVESAKCCGDVFGFATGCGNDKLHA
jgi:hypothetical protein